MKVLIVDDNLIRCDEIVNLLIISAGIFLNDIYVAHNKVQAKKLLRNVCFDFMILDVVLPNRNEPPRPDVGLSLLNELKRRPSLKKPGKIVGITAHFEDIDFFRNDFSEHCEVLIEASSRNKRWKEIIIESVKFETTKMISNYSSNSKITCISVHGIRTHGSWQQDLKKIIQSNVDTINFESYKYGYFTIISFMIPFLRQLRIRDFSKKIISLHNPEHELYFFCHSFGTYIVAKALDKLLKEKHSLNLKMLVFSGSVLPSNYDFTEILKSTNTKIVNDCGYEDKILLLSEALVPNTGMAGRVGFYGLNNSRFVNRFFKGGHSHYFNKNNNFMEKYWLPLFSNKIELEIIDERRNSPLVSGVLEKLFTTLGKLKEIIYVSTFIYFIFYLLPTNNLIQLLYK